MTMEDLTTTNGNGHRPESGQLIRRDFSGSSITRENPMAVAMAAKAQAEITARYTMAMHRPRNMDQVRTSLLKECRRPGFAAQAIYHKPVGDGVEGLSIRFAEAAARCLGNIAMDVSQVYDDETSRVMRVSATDLEQNTVWPIEISIEKTVERKFLRKGQVPIRERTNSKNERVYIVEAGDDDMLNKQAALVSKALRTCILRIIPGNLQDEAYDVCNEILRDKAAQDPDAARNSMCDAFAKQNIHPVALEEWLGHKLESATPAEIEQLRRLFVTIRDGEATWVEALAHRAEQTAAPEKPTAYDNAKAAVEAKGTSAVKDAIKKRGEKKEPQTTMPDATARPPTPDEEREKPPGWFGEPDPK